LIVRSAAPGGFGRCPDSGAQAVMGLRQPGGSRLRFRIHAAVHGRDQIHFLWIAWVTLAISTLWCVLHFALSARAAPRRPHRPRMGNGRL